MIKKTKFGDAAFLNKDKRKEIYEIRNKDNF